jgi:hypothetical protein
MKAKKHTMTKQRNVAFCLAATGHAIRELQSQSLRLLVISFSRHLCLAVHAHQLSPTAIIKP